MNTTKRHIIEQVQLRSGRNFLYPEIETIEDFVELAWFPDFEEAPTGVEPFRGSRAVSPARDFYFLDGTLTKGRWTSLYVRAKRNYGMGIRNYCTEGRIGSYKVVKGAWPDPYALLLANDGHHIASPFVSLIDWVGYCQWLDGQRARLLKGAA